MTMTDAEDENYRVRRDALNAAVRFCAERQVTTGYVLRAAKSFEDYLRNGIVPR